MPGTHSLEYNRAYRAQHRERINEQRRRRYKPHPRPKTRPPWVEIHRERKLRLLALAGGAKCSNCGYDRSIVALDFDHIDPAAKTFPISQNLAVAKWERLVAEVEKCRVLCANCHRIHTFEEPLPAPIKDRAEESL